MSGRQCSYKKRFHRFFEKYLSRRKNTFSSKDVKVSTFNLNWYNSFEHATYHWTSDLTFQHTGANLGVRRSQGHHFLFMGGFFSHVL